MADNLGIAIDLALEGLSGPMNVERVRGSERVSAPFRYEVDFHAAYVDIERARGASAQLELRDARDDERFVHGVVEEITVRPTRWDDRHQYTVVIVPEAALLRHRHGFELHQGLDVLGICERVFERAGLASERLEWRLNASYRTRDVCVQYDESEWAFVSRLLEEEGIWYHFRHDVDGTTMVFGDDSSLAPTAEPDPLTFDFRHSAIHGSLAHELEDTWSLVEGRVELDDYDGLRPSRQLRAQANVEGPCAREWFEYPGRYDAEVDGARLAAARLAELQCPGRVTVLETTAFQTTAGTRVALAGAPLATEDGFIVSNELLIGPWTDDDGEPGDGWEVFNRIEVIAEAQLFRPPRNTPRPMIHGPQTARVVGPADQEVWVDERGRVKLQFHWDRRAQLDEHASQWIPVAHGQVTGAMMHPRIGWEVVVEFRHGDPDRPVVTGRVYNPFFPPPHALPERRTVTAFGSDTLPGRGLVNELRFEDRAGDEHLAVTAARDLREVTVLHRHVTVRHDENREIGADRAEVVGVLRGLRVDQSYSQSVGRGHDVVVGHNRHALVVGNASEQTRANLRLDVTNLCFAQIGTGVPGTLFSALREPIESPAYTVLDAVERILQPAVAAVEPEAGEAGSSQALWAESPGATYALGPVLGGMTEPPTEPPEPPAAPGDHAASESSLVSDLGAAAGTLGDVAQGASDVIGGLNEASEALSDPWGAIGDGVSDLLDADDLGLDSGLGSDLDGLASGVGGVLSEVDQLADIAPFAGALLEVGAAAATSNAQVETIGKAVSAVASLATGAKELGAEPAALGLLEQVTGLADSSSEPGGAVDGLSRTPDDPLAFVAGIVSPLTSAWSGVASAVGDIDATLLGIVAAANIAETVAGAEPEAARHRRSWFHPYEREATHFAATVAAAIIDGEIRDDRRTEEPEEDEEEGEAEQGTEAPPEEEAPENEESGESPSASEPPEEGADEEDDNQPQGRGTWTVRVAGDTAENIAGVAVVGTAGDMRIAVGGDASETIRLARLEQVGENRAEVVQGDKTESAGRCVVTAPEGIELHSDATLRVAVDGDASSTVAGARTLTSADRLEVSAGNLRLNATDTLTFECGAARVGVSADGIAIEGTEITIRGDDIGVDSPALG